MTGEGTITNELIAELRRRLGDERRRLLLTVATTEEELATLAEHQAGSPPEDVPTQVASDVLSRLEGREKHEIDAIDAALVRLGAGTYGTCEGCHQPIRLARLRAMPTARYCVACQHREER